MQRCPYGYYFSSQSLKCLSWNEIRKSIDQIPVSISKGIQVSSASPMFILPECKSTGTFGYPDYRFYYTCSSIEGSALYFSQILFQCPIGLFFNSMFQTCSRASTFAGHQVRTNYFVFSKNIILYF